ncbi:MAG: hypothetical protein ACK5TN_18965, partial [Acidobacteriota bacterium]
QFETQVPPNAQHHNLLVEMATGEQLFDRNESGHSSIFAHPEKFAPEPAGGWWKASCSTVRNKRWT